MLLIFYECKMLYCTKYCFVTLNPMHVVTVVVIGKQEMHYYCNMDQREGMKGLKKQRKTPVEEEGEKGREREREHRAFACHESSLFF